MKRYIFLLFFIICTPFTVSAQLQSAEIYSFDSFIQILPDSSLIVTETIEVYADGDEIQRGIYRDFPIFYKDRLGNNYAVGFDVVGVKRDGKNEPYSVESIRNGKRIRIGDANIFLNPGSTYVYEISYKTTQQLGFFEDHDELYWNVTGNGWEFPIQKASATVSLPVTIPTGQLMINGFTGAQGATQKYFNGKVLFSGRVFFETTKRLDRNEGLTIVVGFPKGYIEEPTTIEKSSNFVKSNYGFAAASVGMFIGLMYFLIIWHKFGKDPKKGTIYPLYEPPCNFSAAQVRYIKRFGFDNRAFVAAVIQLAVDGFIKIKEEDKKVYTLERVENIGESLSKDEAILLSALFSGKKSITIGGRNNYVPNIQEAKKMLKAHLNATVGHYFTHNFGLWFIGIVIFVVSILTYFILGNQTTVAPTLITGIIFSMSVIGMATIVNGIIRRLREFDKGASRYISFAAILFIFLVVFFQFLLTAITSVGVNMGFIVLFAMSIFLVILFSILLRKPTKNGQIILDQVEGFKWFLSVAEKDRMNFHNPPQKTPELFERYLPYALALGVGHQWAEQFSGMFAKLDQNEHTYYPSWYYGRSFNILTVSDFGTSVGQTISRAVSSSSTPPGSSSGFSGGGSSGGGGGGGGGGGW